MGTKPTIQLVAQKAGVSITTVSRVLNSHPAVLPETRAKVLSVMKELDYKPNQLARGLSTNGFDAILVIYTRTDNPYFSTVISAIGIVAEANNYDLILHSGDDEDKEIEKALSMISSRLIKGIILLSSRINSKFIEVVSATSIPIVVIGKYSAQIQAPNVISVDTDNYSDCWEIGSYLVQMGHRKIGCVHAPLGHYVAVDRLAGFRDALRSHGIEAAENCFVDGGNTIDSAYMATVNLLCSHKVTALFATDDIKALGIYKAAKSMHLEIPEELSVIGHNDFEFSSLLTPALTTVRVPIHELGLLSATKLFSMMNSESAEHSQMIPTDMILRNSVKMMGR